MKLSRVMAFLTLSAAHMYVTDPEDDAGAVQQPGTVQETDPDAPLSDESQSLVHRVETLLRNDVAWITSHIEALIAQVEHRVTNEPTLTAAGVPGLQPTVDADGKPVIPAGALGADPAAGSTLEPGEPVKSGEPEVKDE